MDDTRQRIVEAAYACVARRGVAKTTIEDVAREAGMSRATVYRAFPGGRDEVINATVAWATLDFFGRLYERIQGAASLEEVMERGIMFAHRSIVEHEVLQRVMQTEPDKLLPILTVESIRIREGIAAVLSPYLEERGLAAGVDLDDAADFLARMVLSYISAPGRWDLDDPDQVARLVRSELLAGVVSPPEPAESGAARRAGEVRAGGGAGRVIDGETNPDVLFQPMERSAGSPSGGRRRRGRSEPARPVRAGLHGRPPSDSPHRVRIIDGTLACLARHGTVKTTVDDIARESGVSRATVYRAFPGGRDEILGAVVDTEMARLFSALGVRLGTAGDLRRGPGRWHRRGLRPASATTPPCTSWSSTSRDRSLAIWPSPTRTGCWPRRPGSPLPSWPGGCLRPRPSGWPSGRRGSSSPTPSPRPTAPTCATRSRPTAW